MRVPVRQRLLAAAERLMAEGGSSVAMSAVIAAAGVGNNSAVSYHFGGRDGLIETLLHHRLDGLEEYRVRLLADRGLSQVPDDLSEALDLMVWPLMVTPYEDGSNHHARFMEKVRDQRIVYEVLGTGNWPITARISQVLAEQLPLCTEVSPAVLRRRREGLASAMFALLSDAERHDRHRLPLPQRRDISRDLVAMLVGLITAPAPTTSGP